MRIAHLTDIHMRHRLFGVCSTNKRRGRLMKALLPLALDRICATKPDLLVITGDLLDVPLWLMQPIPGFERDEEIAEWSRMARQDYQWIKDCFDGTGIPYQVLPGNHDAPEIMWQVFDQATHTMDVAGVRVVRFCDFEYEGRGPRRFHPERDRWLAQLESRDNIPQLHLQHYLIAPEGDPHTYQDSEAMVRLMVQSQKPILSLSGHFHEGTELIDYDTLKVTAVPAFCEAPFSWRIYETDAHFKQVQVRHHSLETPAPKPVVFLDRDGVINTLPSYRHGPAAMELIPGSAQAIRSLNQAGYAVVVITNQSAVGMGYVPETVVYSVNDKMCRLLAKDGAHFDGIYASFSAGERSVLPRYSEGPKPKPSPDLLKCAAEDLQLDLTHAWMIGDNILDIECGRAIDARTALVLTGHGKEYESEVRRKFPGTGIFPDLAKAVEQLLKTTPSIH